MTNFSNYTQKNSVNSLINEILLEIELQHRISKFQKLKRYTKLNRTKRIILFYLTQYTMQALLENIYIIICKHFTMSRFSKHSQNSILNEVKCPLNFGKISDKNAMDNPTLSDYYSIKHLDFKLSAEGC